MFIKRIAAILYDILIIFCLFILGTAIVVLCNKAENISSQNIYFKIYLMLIYSGYFLYFWTINGQTIGLSAWKLKIINSDNKKMNFKTALLRFLWAIPSILLGGIGLFWALFDAEQQTLYDKFSKSKLIKNTLSSY